MLHDDDRKMVLETYEMSKEDALDQLFEHIENEAFGHTRNGGELPKPEDFARVDAILDFADPKRMSTTLMIGYLTITLWAKDRLARRADFVDRVERELDAHAPDRKERLLDGLR